MALMETIRCVVCQGQAITGSNADLAADMRGMIRERIAAGIAAEPSSRVSALASINAAVASRTSAGASHPAISVGKCIGGKAFGCRAIQCSAAAGRNACPSS